jgi:hypothetical protein
MEIKSLKEFFKVTGTNYNPRKNKAEWDAAFKLYNDTVKPGVKLKNNCSGCRGKVYKWIMNYAD